MPQGKAKVVRKGGGAEVTFLSSFKTFPPKLAKSGPPINATCDPELCILQSHLLLHTFAHQLIFFALTLLLEPLHCVLCDTIAQQFDLFHATFGVMSGARHWYDPFFCTCRHTWKLTQIIGSRIRKPPFILETSMSESQIA